MTLHNFLRDRYGPRHLGISPKTIEEYDRTLRHLQAFAGCTLDTTDLTEQLVLSYLAHRLQKISPQTVKRERADLLAVWREAHRQKLCTTRPEDVPSIRTPRRIPVAWRPEDVGCLLVACRQLKGMIRGTGINKSDWYYSLILFLYDSGARIGAALAVRSDQLDLDGRRAVLAGQVAKTGVEQVVEFSPQTAEALGRHYDARRAMVWPQPYWREQPQRQLTRLLRAAGLPTDRYHKFHCLRRTNYTLSVRYGSRELAHHQLGHLTDMSRYYLDPTQVDTQQAVSVIPRPVSTVDDQQLTLF